MLTLVGTAPNLVADAALQRAEFAGFGFFTFTPFGTVILGAGIAYMLLARRWLNREPLPIPLPGFARPMHRALVRVAQLLGASAVLPEDAHLIATVHDELILDCPAVTAEQCRNIAEAAMKEAFVRDVWRHRSRGGRSQGMRQLGEK